MDPNKPEPTPKGVGREVTPLVIKDLELRSKMGAEKYGETLRAFNGRNALVDAYQEALDLVQYLRQALEEQPQAIGLDNALDAVDLEITPHITSTYDGAVVPSDLYTRPGRFIAVQGNPTAMTAREFIAARAQASESIAQEAHRLVLGSRGESYGHPIFDMTRTADMVTALLRHKLKPGARLEAEDVGQMMIAVKQSRHQNKPKRDNEVDIAGYALCLEMIAEWRREHTGVDPRDVFPEV
jgi:hypothetical protein